MSIAEVISRTVGPTASKRRTLEREAARIAGELAAADRRRHQLSMQAGQPRFWLEAAKVGAAVAIPVCADLDRFDSGSLNEKGSVQPSWSPLNVF